MGIHDIILYYEKLGWYYDVGRILYCHIDDIIDYSMNAYM